MAIRIIIAVKETEEALKVLLRKASLHQRPRLKMLLLLARGPSSTADLATGTGANTNSIAAWKNKYASGGLAAMFADGRVGFSEVHRIESRVRALTSNQPEQRDETI